MAKNPEIKRRILFEKRDLNLMSHTSINQKFKMRWFENERVKDAIELQSCMFVHVLFVLFLLDPFS